MIVRSGPNESESYRLWLLRDIKVPSGYMICRPKLMTAESMEPLKQFSRRVMARADAAFPLPKPAYLDSVICPLLMLMNLLSLTHQNESHTFERTLYLEVELSVVTVSA